MFNSWDFRLPRLPIAQWLIIALIAIALSVVMHEVQDLKQQIRQANYSAVVSNLRAALIERWVETQVLPRQGVAEEISGLNPMRLLKQLPDNYLGELNAAPSDAEDIWFFNTKQNCLVYVEASGQQILHPLVKGSVTKGMLGGWDIAPTLHTK
ncbi:MAG TPA: hypothetical protein VGJ90_04525 [Methylophilaceae bacterium]|jgi:hypothetical protein